MIRSGIRAEDGFQACSGKGRKFVKKNVIAGQIFSIVLMLIGAYVFYSGMAFRGNDKYFPMIIGGGMVIVSIWMLIEDMRTQKASIDLDKINFVAIGITIVALCIYILLFRKIGYVLSTILLGISIIGGLRYNSGKGIILWPTFMVLVIFVIFKILLKVPLPTVFL